jgi:hypothetical protein
MADDHRDFAAALHDHRRMGSIDDSVLVAGLIGITDLALRDGDTDSALTVVAGLPEGWEHHIEFGSPSVQEAAQNLAQLFIDKGLVNEGVDVSLYGAVGPTQGPLS